MDARLNRFHHLVLCAVATTCSVASIEQLFIVGPTGWTMAFNVLSLMLVLTAFKTRPVRQP